MFVKEFWRLTVYLDVSQVGDVSESLLLELKAPEWQSEKSSTTACVTLDKLFDFSVSQLLHL